MKDEWTQPKPAIGTRVRHIETEAIARVEQIYPDVDGGVILDRHIDGFRSWNMADLEVLSDEL